ncbi:HAD hydrolase-like protein [Streptomyces sp. MS1.AVA.3]|uniref:HAD family hydrolase n=1 Tax=Streptomyces decoyicus TaxID=249567 RepID=UPI0030C1864B
MSRRHTDGRWCARSTSPQRRCDETRERAQAKHGTACTRSNTVIIGDSLEDVRTGLVGGASVLGVTSGKTSAQDLKEAGAEVVLDSLENVAQLVAAIAAVTP